VRIRLARPSDASNLLQIYHPFVRSTPVTFEEGEISERQFATRIEETLKTKPWLVAEEGDSTIGYASASSFNSRAAYRWSVNVSVYVAEGHHRKGVATQLYRALFDALRILNYQNALAGITLPNAASITLHEAMGFKRVALYERIGFKLGRWHDVAWYQLALQNSERPEEPIALPEAAERISARLLQAR
jgi:L-amino acid N-acyltransferase YncA